MMKVRAVSRLCELHLGIRLTTQEKARKTLIYSMHGYELPKNQSSTLKPSMQHETGMKVSRYINSE
jgi:hypothetical protein